MKNKTITTILFILTLTASIHGYEASFDPPTGWRNADSDKLPPHVKLIVVGSGGHDLPPSISLGTEKFDGTLKDYLAIVKKINESKGDQWKDLGNVETKSGPASLSQVDIKTEWGVVREMHLISLSNGMIYIMTAAALKKEFATFYPVFFKAMRSFKVE